MDTVAFMISSLSYCKVFMPADQMTGYTSPPPPPPRSVFATRIPSTVTFAIGLLLFALPFAELKCKLPKQKEISMLNLDDYLSFTNSGIGLALGSDWKTSIPIGDLGQNGEAGTWKKNIKQQKPNYYAVVALIMAVLGLGLSFVQATPVAVATTVAGGISVGALVGLMVDLQKKSRDIISAVQDANQAITTENHAKLVLSFTPWFFIAIIFLLAATVFSYKRILSAAP